MSECEVVIRISRMQHEMQQDAVDYAKQAMGKYKNLEKKEKLLVCQYIEIMGIVGLL
jgi:hypothetical protein